MSALSTNATAPGVAWSSPACAVDPEPVATNGGGEQAPAPEWTPDPKQKPMDNLAQWFSHHHGRGDWGDDGGAKCLSWPTGCPQCDRGPVLIPVGGDGAKCLACGHVLRGLLAAIGIGGENGDDEGTGTDDSRPEPGRSKRHIKATWASDVKPERVGFLEDGRIPVGMPTIVAGSPGLGKSTYTCLIAAGFSKTGKVVMLNAEDGDSTTIRPRLAAAGANLDNVAFIKMEDEHGEDGLRLPDDGVELDAFVKKNDIQLVVVDPIMAHLGGKIDGHRDQDARAAMAPLHRLGVTVIVVAHLKKGAESEVLNKVGGSIGFTASVRSVLAFARDPDDPDGERGVQRIVSHAKNNVGPLRVSRVYRVEEAQDGPATTSRLVYHGDSDKSASDVLSPQQPREATREDAAVEFLRDKLSEGARPTVVVETDAEGAGISHRTLERARKTLGVLSARGEGGGFWLSLPDTSAKALADMAEVAEVADIDVNHRQARLSPGEPLLVSGFSDPGVGEVATAMSAMSATSANVGKSGSPDVSVGRPGNGNGAPGTPSLAAANAVNEAAPSNGNGSGGVSPNTSPLPLAADGLPTRGGCSNPERHLAAWELLGTGDTVCSKCIAESVRMGKRLAAVA